MTQVVKAPLDTVYALARDVDRYPDFMPTLRKIEVLRVDPDGAGTLTRWHAETRILAATRTMIWTQRDRWDHAARICVFELDPAEPGRYKNLRGRWRFNPHARGAEMIVDIDFTLDHPMLTPTLHKVLDKLMERNNIALLCSMKRAAEVGCPRPARP